MNRPYCVDLYHEDSTSGSWVAALQAAGILFLDHKISQGTTEVDAACKARRAEWLAGDLVTVTEVNGTILKLKPRFGFYHFNGTGSAVAEANHFVTSAKAAGYQPGDDMCLDWEDIGASGFQQSAAWADDFCSYVEDAFGFAMKVYGGDAPSGQLQNAPKELIERFSERRLWFCEYGTYNPKRVPLPWQGQDPDYWQDDGDRLGPGPHTLPGIIGPVDNSTVVGSATVARLYARWAGGMTALTA